MILMNPTSQNINIPNLNSDALVVVLEVVHLLHQTLDKCVTVIILDPDKPKVLSITVLCLVDLVA